MRKWALVRLLLLRATGVGAGTVDLPASSSAPADDPLLAAALAFRDLEWRYLSSLSPERAERLKGRHRCFAVQHAVRFVEVYMVLCGAVPAALLACEGDDAYATELVATALTPVMHAHGLAARGYRALEARAPTCSTPRGWVFMAGAHARAGLVARVLERDPAGASPEDVAAALGWPTPRGSVPVMYVEMHRRRRGGVPSASALRARVHVLGAAGAGGGGRGALRGVDARVARRGRAHPRA